MKFKHIFLLLIVFYFDLNMSAYAAGKQSWKKMQIPTDTLVTNLESLNLVNYIGKPVDTLLAHLPAGVIDMKITGWRSIRRAEILHVVYPNKLVVEIHVTDFQYMNPGWVNTPTPTQNWSISLFKKEKIAYAIIFNGTTCINGCGNEFK